MGREQAINDPAQAAASLDLSWVVRRYGSMRAGVEQAEARAVAIVREEHDGSDEWSAGYIAAVRDLPHKGDCGACRTWLRGPITCDACVYDELMVRAWEAMRAEPAPSTGD